MPASLSTGCVTTASDSTSLKLGFSSAKQKLRGRSQGTSVQKHSGHHSWSPCRLPIACPTATSTLHPEVCPHTPRTLAVDLWFRNEDRVSYSRSSGKQINRPIAVLCAECSNVGGRMRCHGAGGQAPAAARRMWPHTPMLKGGAGRRKVAPTLYHTVPFLSISQSVLLQYVIVACSHPLYR